MGETFEKKKKALLYDSNSGVTSMCVTSPGTGRPERQISLGSAKRYRISASGGVKVGPWGAGGGVWACGWPRGLY